jgi:hypothetical protein
VLRLERSLFAGLRSLPPTNGTRPNNPKLFRRLRTRRKGACERLTRNLRDRMIASDSGARMAGLVSVEIKHYAPSPSRIYERILITYLVMCAIQLPNFWPLTYWPAMVEPSAEMVMASVRIVPAGILAPRFFSTVPSCLMPA